MKIWLKEKNLELDFEGTIEELLLHLKVNPETVLVSKNNEIVNLNTKTNKRDEIKIISVISGG